MHEFDEYGNYKMACAPGYDEAMTTDLRDKTVEELHRYCFDGGVFYGIAAIDELARRLSEAHQQIAERDAMLATCHGALHIAVDFLTADEHPWDMNSVPLNKILDAIKSLPASAKHNAAIIKAAEYLEYTLSHMNQIAPEDQADAHYDAEQGLLSAVRAKGEKV